MRGKKAFTLIELMLVVVIIGALAAMVVPRYVGWGEKAKKATAKADVKVNIAGALKMFEIENGKFPSTQDGLKALRQKPSWASNWDGPYLENEPIDPWGNSYKYVRPGSSGSDYGLSSTGPDGKEGGGDDIVSWQ